MVLIHHIEQLRNTFGLDNNWDNNIVQRIGKLGVILFFVLSGFLISYLLFKEEAETNSINIKGFYMRRIFRIWPLYFLIIVLALFVFPCIEILKYPNAVELSMSLKLFKALPMYIFFLPNLVLVAIAVIPFCSQTWSIGAEEQFYMIWPVLNKFIKNKLMVIFGVIVVYLLIKLFLGSHKESLLFRFWDTMPIHYMAIGGFFGYISFFESSLTRFLKTIIYTRIMQFVSISFIFILLYFKISIGYFNLELYALLFGVIILNAATGTKNIFCFNFSFIKYMGKISYGIYMYHLIGIIMTLQILIKLDYSLNNFVIYFMSFVITITISSISYYTFEKFFMNFKKKYSVVPTADNKQTEKKT